MTAYAPVSVGWDIVRWAKADPTGVSDSTALIQALLDNLYANRGTKTGDTIIVPDGTFSITTLKYYVESGYAQSIVGRGASSRFVVASDSGVGTYAIRPSKSRSSTQKPLLQGFRIQGKATGGYLMHGVAIASSGTMRDVFCEKGFKGGLVALNDHCIFDNCTSNGSTYNLLFGYQYQAKDNHIVLGGNYTDGISACIAIAGNNTLGGSLLQGFHIGNAPYGFYKLSAGDTANFETFYGETMDVGANIYFSSNTCIALHFENITTAPYGAADTTTGAQMQNNKWYACDQSGFTGAGSAIFCDNFSSNSFDGSESLLVKGGSGSYVELPVATSAANIAGNFIRTNGGFGALATLTAADFDNKDRSGWYIRDGAGCEIRPCKADAAIAQGDLLMQWVGGTAGSYKPFDSTQASAVSGVARTAGTNGSYFFRQTRGPISRVNLKGTPANIDTQHYLIPTSTVGAADGAASGVAATTRPIGRATSGDLGGYCTAELHL